MTTGGDAVSSRNVFVRLWNVPTLHRAPFMLYFFLALVAIGVAIMCVRFRQGDTVTASIVAALTCGLVVALGVFIALSLSGHRAPEDGSGKRSRKRVTVCLKAHQFEEDASLGAEKSDTTCAICLVEMEGGEKVVTLDCGHVYHVDCICNWTRRVAICPACRYSLPVMVESAGTSAIPSPVAESPV